MMQKNNLNNNIVNTLPTNHQGLIETTCLEMIDKMVGGLINSEAALCLFNENENNMTKNYGIK